jgi:hypothetical protein
MTLPRTIEGREQAKFVECNDNTAVRTTICQGDGESVKVEFDEAGFGINSYNELLSVAGLATGDLLLYTVPVGKTLKLQRIDFSGENKAVYKIDINGSIQAKKRTWYTSYNDYITFNNLTLNAGDIVKLIVENKTNMTADFNGNLQGQLSDA